MRNCIATTLILLGGCAACGGCNSPNPHPGHSWHPRTEQEMRQIIGETLMQAIHQHRQHIIEQTRKQARDLMPNHFPRKPIT